jgi:hypothetical protein
LFERGRSVAICIGCGVFIGGNASAPRVHATADRVAPDRTVGATTASTPTAPEPSASLVTHNAPVRGPQAGQGKPSNARWVA